MHASAAIPGDNQSPQAVEAWVRANVSTGTVMVLRKFGEDGIEFHLAEVDLMSTSSTFLFAPAWGSFETTGQRAFAAIDAPCLLVPLRDVVTAAVDGQVWADGLKTLHRRERSSAEIDLILNLNAQAARRGD